MATSVVFPRVQFFANNGRPLIGGRIHTYVAGSSTRARTYKDAAKAQPNTNPIILDGRGEAAIYLAEGVEYKFVIEDSKGALIMTQEPVYGAIWPNAESWPSDATLSYQYMMEAKAAAGAIGPIKFYDTYAQALGDIANLIEGDLVEVSRDEASGGARTRYRVEAGVLVFTVNLDQLRIDLADATALEKGAAMVARGAVSVEDFSQLSDQHAKEDQRYLVKGYHPNGVIGGGEVYWDAASTEAADGINTFAAPAIHTGRWKRSRASVDIADAGAVPGAAGASATTEAFLRAIAEGQIVTYPYHPDGWHVQDTLVFAGFQELIGPGKYLPGIQGNFNKPIIRFGRDSDLTQRKNTIRNASIINTGGDAVAIINSPNWSIVSCNIGATGSGAQAVYSRYSWRPYMSNTEVGSSGQESFAIRLMDNTNGGGFYGITASGGSGGGVLDVGRSYNLEFNSFVMESTKYGMRFGVNTDEAQSGECNGIKLSNINWEQSFEPLNVGSKFAVHGFAASGLFISNRATTTVADRDWAIKLGRVRGGYISGLVLDLHDTESALNLYQEPEISALVRSIEDFSISNVSLKNTGQLYKLSGSFETMPSALSQIVRLNNVIDIGTTRIGYTREYISGTISTEAAISSVAYDSVGGFGGKLESIEIIEASGTLSGILTVGSPVAGGELLALDLSTVVLTNGRAVVKIPTPSANFIRPNNACLWGLSGTPNTAGTFRLRIKYRT